MELRSKLNRMQTFVLDHDAVCTPEVCYCRVQALPCGIASRLVPSSITVLALETTTVDSNVRKLRSVVDAVALGHIELSDDEVSLSAALGGKRQSRARRK